MAALAIADTNINHSNQTSRNLDGSTSTLSYDAENRLTTVSGATSASFTYDGDGNRVKSVMGNVTTYYIGNYFEWTGSTSTMVKYYYAGGQRVAMKKGSVTTWLFGDHLGSTSKTYVNGSPNSDTEQRYYPWGGTRYGSSPTAFQYTGQRNDSAIGLYFYNARYYDPSLGRFIQADSIVPNFADPQSLNRYSYTLNNPLKYTDPSGHDLMLVGGKGGNFYSSKWEKWVRAYKGWDETQWKEVSAEWDRILKDTGNLGELNTYLQDYGIRMFNWGTNDLEKAEKIAAGAMARNGGDVGKDDVLALSQEMAGMQDITLVGWSKGANLVNQYLKMLDRGNDLTRPKHAVLISQPNLTAIPLVGPVLRVGAWAFAGIDWRVNQNLPAFTDINTAWICAPQDGACAGSAKNAINYTGRDLGISGHGPHGAIAGQVYADLNVQYDHNASGGH